MMLGDSSRWSTAQIAEAISFALLASGPIGGPALPLDASGLDDLARRVGSAGHHVMDDRYLVWAGNLPFLPCVKYCRFESVRIAPTDIDRLLRSGQSLSMLASSRELACSELKRRIQTDRRFFERIDR
jgi:hypothetical protein